MICVIDLVPLCVVGRCNMFQFEIYRHVFYTVQKQVDGRLSLEGMCQQKYHNVHTIYIMHVFYKKIFIWFKFTLKSFSGVEIYGSLTPGASQFKTRACSFIVTDSPSG